MYNNNLNIKLGQRKSEDKLGN